MPRRSPIPPRPDSESGFALVGLIVAIFLILLALSVAAPTVARALRHEQEVEAIHRAEQYTRAIRIFYKKTGRYPASLDELQKTNNIRFLRRAYLDPFTGKADWRLIKVGENKTSVKGLFGQPLAGVASTGLGSVAGMQSSFGSSSASPTADSATSPAGASTTTSSTSSTSGTSSGIGGSGFGSMAGQSATGFSGSGAPFLGVGLPRPGESITTVNEKTTYPEWEFLYDPRVEQLRSRVNIFGGSMGSTSATTFGSSNSLNSSGSSPTSNSSSPFNSPYSPSSGGGGFGSMSGGSSSTSPTSPSSNPNSTSPQ